MPNEKKSTPLQMLQEMVNRCGDKISKDTILTTIQSLLPAEEQFAEDMFTMGVKLGAKKDNTPDADFTQFFTQYKNGNDE